jgi:AmmeMemoRadiSam system protein B/AmmeMemoRadiSam system protein A
MTTVRPAAVAGAFYPAQSAALRAQVRACLRDARPAGHTTPPKALIVPHAGYVYSGPIAASAYARLTGLRERIRRVVLLGPVHRVPLRGVALPGVDAFETPLGTIAIDRDAAAALTPLPHVVVDRAAHATEHSLEVQLPFLQETLAEFTLVPLAVGDASADEVADVLQTLWGGAETLVVISSDLSHYLPYDLARRTDTASVQTMLDLSPTLDHLQACGATPVNGLLTVARRLGLRAELIDLRNSGDTAGDKGRVVGYGALAFYEPGAARAIDDDTACESGKSDILLSLARGAIAREFGIACTARTEAAFLLDPGATFVTLRKSGELRGCIGSLEVKRALGDDVQHNARAAAFSDPRFAPLARDEFDAIRVEVSVLSAARPMEAGGDAQLHAQLRPGIDGLILEYREQRATFLPQVWDALPDPSDFVVELKRKAGLPAHFWHRDLRLARYTVEKFSEH